MNYFFYIQCSQSCGRGVQTRKARCVELSPIGARLDQQLLLDSCNATRAPDETRACKGFARHSLECGVSVGNRVDPQCRRDKGQLCATRNLAIYCKDAAFRKRCCVSCRGK